MNKLLILLVGVALVCFGLIVKAHVKHSPDTNIIVLTSNNVASLTEEVNEKSVSDVMDRLKVLNSSKLDSLLSSPIHLFIRSPGGDIQSGIELAEAIKGSRRPVDTVTMFAASMAFQTVQQTPGLRYILGNGVLMSHRARGSISGEFGGVKPGQLDSRVSFWERRIGEMDALTVSRTLGKQTIESYQASYVPELWATGSEAVDKGYADQIVTVVCDDSLKGTTTHSLETPFGILQYELDNCPLNSMPKNIQFGQIFTNHGVMTEVQFQLANGEFGVACLKLAATNPAVVCATDTSLNNIRLQQIKHEAVNKFVNIQDNTIPMEVK
jgi:ATP-dependent protease ClpP protease subunit